MVWYSRKGNKYGAVKNQYNGETYHSKKEAGYAKELDIRLRAKDIKKWERQVKIPLDVNGYHICNYYIDFIVYENDGTETWTEIKGFETDIWRMKWKLTKALYGENKKIKLLVIK